MLREDLHARYGGEVLYFNGALGVLIGPGGAHVWEVTDDYPLGNQLVAPAGAQAPGGGTDYTVRNFRRTAIIGEQLALAVERLLDEAVRVDSAEGLVHGRAVLHPAEQFRIPGATRARPGHGPHQSRPQRRRSLHLRARRTRQ